MDSRTNEQPGVEVYEPPALVALGEFSEDTLGAVPAMAADAISGQLPNGSTKPTG